MNESEFYLLWDAIMCADASGDHDEAERLYERLNKLNIN